MALRRKFATAIAVQSIGPAALFFTVWLIARQFGVEAQGQFAAVKSFVELMAACLLFGLPQSFVFGINKLDVNRNQLVRWTIGYGLTIVVVPGGLLWAAGALQWLVFESGGQETGSSYYLALAAAGLVTYGLLRGVYLTVSDGWRFSALTIFPALILSSIVFASIATAHFSAVKIYALTGLLSALVGVFFLRKHTKPAQFHPLPWKSLLENGGAVFLQGIFLTAQPYLTLALLRSHTGNFTDVAHFSLAMYVYQAGVIPLTMVAPILYSRWTSTTTSNNKFSEATQLLWGLIPISALVAVAWLLAPWMLSAAFDKSYESATDTIRIMIATVPLLYVVHVGTPVLMSMGLFRTNVLIVASRFSICTISLFILFFLYPEVRSKMAAISWLIAEFMTATLTVYILKKKSSQGVAI